MKCGVMFVGLALLACAPGTVAAQGKKNAWLNDYEEAKILAKKTGKPLMVVFRCEP